MGRGLCPAPGQNGAYADSQEVSAGAQWYRYTRIHGARLPVATSIINWGLPPDPVPPVHTAPTTPAPHPSTPAPLLISCPVLSCPAPQHTCPCPNKNKIQKIQTLIQCPSIYIHRPLSPVQYSQLSGPWTMYSDLLYYILFEDFLSSIY